MTPTVPHASVIVVPPLSADPATAAFVVPPAHALRDEVAALAAALLPQLSLPERLSPPRSLHAAAAATAAESSPPPRPAVALWRLSPPAALAAYHVVRAALHATPVWLNDRWTVEDAVAALAVAPCAALLADLSAVPPPDLARLSAALAASGTRLLSVVRRTCTRPVYDVAPQATNPSSSSSSSPPPLPLPSSEHFTVFFTSGTTVSPKAVPLSDENLSVQSRAKHHHLRMSRGQTRYLHLAPLFHLSGFSSAHAVTALGATHVLPQRTPHVRDAPALVAMLHAARVSLLVAVPTVLRALLSATDMPTSASAPPSLQHVSTVLYGGVSLPPRMLGELAARFPRARILGAYGLTETGSSNTFVDHTALPPQSPLHASSGCPAAHVSLTVDAPAPGLIGEVVIAGPHVACGYISARDGLTPFSPRSSGCDNVLRTGDFARIDPVSGALFLVGRRDDIIKSAGEKVFAPEVEAVILAVPFVRDAAVVGIPHEFLGEAVVAAVELADGVNPSSALTPAVASVVSPVSDILAACRVLAGFKRPKWVSTFPQLPRTATGKVLKHRVKELLQSRAITTAKL